MGDRDTLIVQARNPRRFYADFAGLVLEEDFDIRRMETLDDSAHAVLGYLLGGRPQVERPRGERALMNEDNHR